jgi:hypothetical protein
VRPVSNGEAPQASDGRETLVIDPIASRSGLRLRLRPHDNPPTGPSRREFFNQSGGQGRAFRELVQVDVDEESAEPGQQRSNGNAMRRLVAARTEPQDQRGDGNSEDA